MAAQAGRQNAARLDVWEEPAGRGDEQDVLHDGEDNSRYDVAVVDHRGRLVEEVPHHQEDKEHRDVLRHGYGGADVCYDIVAVVRAKDHAPVRE